MDSPTSDKLTRAEPTDEERQLCDADRLQATLVRVLVGQALHSRGITTTAVIGTVIGMPAAEATKLMTSKQWRAGDVALLEAAATKLGLVVNAEGERQKTYTI
ncbi:hypothetical protein [Belnapia moabensis]|uniref:hypothetical protein n=1 Tax=Belnapia moabensis TaxID=365533 RepID=UPI0005B77652|nr:hypothetical protein [Belnapia moabensis]